MKPPINTDEHGNAGRINRKSIRVYPEKLKHEEISYQIIKAAFEVHNILGCGFLEKVYENALIHELNLSGLKVETQKEIKVAYKGKEVGLYTADIVVDDKIIIELKVVEEITKIHQAQLLNYLKATGYEVGLIINFAKPKLAYERLVR